MKDNSIKEKKHAELITFGMPAYKNECLEDAIESILNQTYKNIELVIVNDASPEDVKETVKKYNDPRIRYYENKVNIGKYSPVKNWNKVLEYAKGQYFILASDDDVYMRTFAAELLECLLGLPDTNIVHCRLTTIDKNGKVVISSSCPYWESGIDFVWHGFRSSRILSISEFLCRTKSLQRIGGFVNFPLAWSSDYATWFMLAQRSGIGYVKNILLEKRNFGKNLTSEYPLSLAIKSCYEYSIWFKKFIETLEVRNELDKILLIDIDTDLNTYFDKLLISSCSNYWSNHANIISPITLFIQWFSWRKRYGTSYKVFIISEINLLLSIGHRIMSLFKRSTN